MPRSLPRFCRATIRFLPVLALIVVVLASLSVTHRVKADPTFTPGNLVLLVAGGSVSNTTGSVIEINSADANQSAIQTITLPDTSSVDSYRISGSATSTGYVSLSNDRTLFTFNGANSTNTASNVNTLNPRGVYTVNSAGSVVKQTTYTGASGNQTRSATSLDDVNWYISDQGGLYTNGASAASPAGNFRAAKSFGGTVYLSQASGTATTIQVVTASAPSGGTVTGLPGLTNNANLQDFYLVSSGDNGSAYDILYLLSATSNTAGAIAKYSLVSGTWTANGSYTTTFGGFGLAAADAGPSELLYVTSGQGALTGNNVIKLTDAAGYNATINVTTADNVTLYTAAAGTIIKGLDFAPVAAAPTVSLSVSTTSASEAAATAVTVTATASSAVNGDQTVSLGVSGTNITAGDYTLTSSTITIPNGQTTGSVTFTVVDDSLVEGTETATLTISSPSSGITLGSPVSEDITIADNDIVVVTPAVNLSVSTNAASEAAATAVTVTATASAPVTGNQTVSLGVGGMNITAGDYTLTSPTITILDGQSTGSATLTVVDDTLVEGTETAILTIGNPSAGITLGATTTQNITIADNDVVPVTAVDLSTYIRVGRYDLPEPTRTTPPPNSLLAQEASTVTYDWDTDTLFVVGDGGTSVVQVTKTGALIDSMTLAPGPSPQGTDFYDTEGVTYVGNGQFVIIEERYRQANLFTYVAGGVLHKTDVKTVKLGTTIGNIGLEGVTWDPMTGEYIFVKEKQPESIFQTAIDWNAGTATNGSPSTDESINLFDPALANVADFSDVFALSNLPALNGLTDYSHLLIISQESGQIINVDRAGNVSSKLTIVADPGSPLSVADMTMEGVTMDRNGVLYVVNEDGGGDVNHPQLWVYQHSTAPDLAPTAISLNNAVNSIPQNADVSSPLKLADIIVTDDGLGNNNLTVSGADAGSFQIIGTGLYLKAGTVLNSATKPSYSISVNVDDPAVGSTPDATIGFNLTVTAAVSGPPSIIISEVAPWSSGNSSLAADWFEVTNIGSTTVDITGWKMDDNSDSFGSAVALSGITSIAAGESVIFIESDTPSTIVPAFKTLWFGANPPANPRIGTYTGSGVGLSTGGDAVNLFDSAGVLMANVSFGTSPNGPFPTFDNSAGLNNATISTLSSNGVNGAFLAANDSNEIGSPGTIGSSSTPIVAITATDPDAAESGSDPGTFRIARSGSTIGPLNVIYTIATGAGQATSADYTPTLAGTATIPSGQSFVDITITPVDDLLAEGPETVTLILGDTGSYDVGVPGTATVTIADNDLPNQAPTAVVLNNSITTLTEDTSTASAIKVADIAVTDDGQGTNNLTITGTDSGFFEISGSSLYLNAGTVLNAAVKSSYSITVNVDDPTVGNTPAATVNYTLTVLPALAPGTLVISEVAPWSSGNSPVAADWFEVTNTGARAVNITGWKMDDNSNSFASAVALNGITSIAGGESVIFIESDSPSTIIPAFKTLWFGANPPAGLQIGTYSGSGVGLSSSSDAVNLFNGSGVLESSVSFGASPAGPSFPTFDNAAGLNNATISQLSAPGVHNAFAAVNDANEIGSPGFAGNLVITEVAPWSSGNSPLAADWFEVTNTGAKTADITGWKMDDSSKSFGSAVALNGITSIGPGESVIFIESDSPSTVVPAFKTLWFGANPPAGLQIGTYSGSGVGLSTSGDGVNLFNSGGVLEAGVSFGASPTGPSFPTFDNAAGLNNTSISQLSVAGVHEAFVAVNDANEIGSPGTVGKLFISEVAPWSSGDSPLGADWFEVTNTSANAVNITGWKMDDNSNSFGSAVSLNGITSIAPGESVIFIESDSPSTIVPAFKTLWFGANPPAGLQIGAYSGSGVGLSTSGDAVNLFDSTGLWKAGVSFGVSPSGPSFPTFDNAAGLNNAAISRLSVNNVDGAFMALGDVHEIGSPGRIVNPVCATDVGSSISIVRSGLVLNFGTLRFSQTLTLTNNGGSSINGPISLVLDSLSGNAALFNPTGATACAAPLGSPYMNSSADSLAPGAKSSIMLQFTDPTKTAITYNPRILAGTAPR